MTIRWDGPQAEAELAGVARGGAAPVPRHAAFRAGFIWVALAMAVFAGFALAAHLSVVIGFGYRLGAAFPALVQAHGHAQLIGWAGMFVIGVSLYFIPRLASVPLAYPRWIDAILWLMGTGLAVRVVGQSTLAYGAGPVPLEALRWLVVASGGLEGVGVLLYLRLVLGSVRGTGDLRTQPAFAAVRPFFGMMVVGWLLYAGANVLALWDMGLRGQAVAHSAWNEHQAPGGVVGGALDPVLSTMSTRNTSADSGCRWDIDCSAKRKPLEAV